LQQPRLIIDSNVLISAFDKDDEHNKDALDILQRRLLDAKPGTVFISEFILSEVIAHITRKQKYKERNEGQRRDYMSKVVKFRQSPKVKVIQASEAEVATALHFVEKYPDIHASLADWLSMVLAVYREIPVIQTYDRDFRHILARDPKFKEVKVWSNLE
jgi:predicted nucleic acid-binding protein